MPRGVAIAGGSCFTIANILHIATKLYHHVLCKLPANGSKLGKRSLSKVCLLSMLFKIELVYDKSDIPFLRHPNVQFILNGYSDLLCNWQRV